MNMIGYWFFIDPYVFISVTDDSVLLYNTLDGVVIESKQKEIIHIIKEVILVENSGVIFLPKEYYETLNIKDFISELRAKYMGDIIDSSLSNNKPIQLLPYYNYPNKVEIYKKHNFSLHKNILKNLFEVKIHLGENMNIDNLILFLHSLPDNLVYDIIGTIEDKEYFKLLSYLYKNKSLTTLFLNDKELLYISANLTGNFQIKVLLNSSIETHRIKEIEEKSRSLSLEIEYIFNISSDEEYSYVEDLTKQFKIKKYKLNPIYTGQNMDFFKKNVFLSKDDILSTHLSIKELFSRQAINIYDFGKINIMPNGDVYANLHHPMIGNIHINNIYEIIQKEVNDGISWFRIRNQYPCSSCVYQWICPSPSDYEIILNRPNLCHIKE